MREAEDPNTRGAGERIERGRLHFHRKDAFTARGLDGFCSLTKGSVRRPAAPTTQRGPISASAVAAAFTRPGSASPNSDGGA